MTAKLAGSGAGNQYGTFEVKYCSPAQARFIQRLLDERIHEFEITDANMINKKHASRIIEQLLKCPKKLEAIKPISEKQISFLELLTKSRVGAERITQNAFDKYEIDSLFKLNADQASELINYLVTQPKIPAPIEVTVGAYRKDGIFYSVRKVRDKEALYVLQYDPNTKEWIRNFKMLYTLKTTDRLSLSDASAFGVATGTCVHCGRSLTLQKSVVAGMGKWCATHYN